MNHNRKVLDFTKRKPTPKNRLKICPICQKPGDVKYYKEGDGRTIHAGYIEMGFFTITSACHIPAPAKEQAA